MPYVSQERFDRYRAAIAPLAGYVGFICLDSEHGDGRVKIVFCQSVEAAEAGGLSVAEETFVAGQDGMPPLQQIQADLAEHWAAIAEYLIGAILATPRGQTMSLIIPPEPPPAPLPDPVTIDDGDPGYSEPFVPESPVTWTVLDDQPGLSYGPTYRTAPATDPVAVGVTDVRALWTFSPAPMGSTGRFRVLVTWVPDPGRSPKAIYHVNGPEILLALAEVDQRAAPAGVTIDGRQWQEVYRGDLNDPGGAPNVFVRLATYDADPGAVCADAVRVEALGPGD